MSRRFPVVGLVLAFVAAGWSSARPSPARSPSVMRIGMLKSMFRDVPAPLFNAMAVPFQTVMEQQTGLKGKLVVIDSAEELTRQLVDGNLQLGAYHGFEFAWMKLREPKLEPLMLVSSNPNMLQSVVVVANTNPASTICECRGQKISVANGAREHSRLFLARQCRKHGASVQDFFPASQAALSLEDALDDVVDGVAQVAVVEQATLNMYARRKPGRHAKLKTLSLSEPFPPSVIAASRGQLDDETLQKFRNGMTTAHKTTLGNHLMALMKINGFEPVPGNYDQRLAEIVRAYPPPG